MFGCMSWSHFGSYYYLILLFSNVFIFLVETVYQLLRKQNPSPKVTTEALFSIIFVSYFFYKKKNNKTINKTDNCIS